ncbi:hypothetical protein RSPO_c00523 [Ralstonia solanacearum Po82]|uniref:Uncharacterized protein n=1 Tax=Ralstonia solanacearum (strain Po82) TaxID=1031711 RepID=F6FXU3_RALS8|nr:hypothetical protein RSPO_c00523 [Ralstonia solanacearum Po82]
MNFGAHDAQAAGPLRRSTHKGAPGRPRGTGDTGYALLRHASRPPPVPTI